MKGFGYMALVLAAGGLLAGCDDDSDPVAITCDEDVSTALPTCKSPYSKLFVVGEELNRNLRINVWNVLEEKDIDKDPDLVLKKAVHDGPSYSLAYAESTDTLIAADYGNQDVYFYDKASALKRSSTPSRSLEGGKVTTHTADVEIDEQRDLLYVAGRDGIAIFENASTIDGNRAPRNVVTAVMASDQRLALDVKNDILYVSDSGSCDIHRFENASTLKNGSSPDATFVTPCSFMWGLALDAERDILYVGDQTDANIRAYDRISRRDAGNLNPSRVIEGGKTTIGGPADIHLDVARDVLYVADADGDQVLVFDTVSKADGNVAPAYAIDATNTVLNYPGGVVGIR
jgi:hypothetical protein